MDIELVFYGLRAGLVFSIGLVVITMLSVLVNPEIWVNDYPPDIRQRFGPIGDRAKRQRFFVAVLFFGWVIGGIVLALRGAAVLLGGPPGLWQAALVVFLILQTFNTADLLLIDWGLFLWLQPARLILPGTQGMAGYKDYGFHFRGYLAGSVGIFAASLIFAALSLLTDLM